MIYAIPSRNAEVANHFSRSPQVLIVDDERNTHQLITLVETPSQCGKKKQWMEILDTYQVDAVVVRAIGKKMLQRLFDRQLTVLVSPAKVPVQELDFANLEQVKSLEYGREPRKQSGCCGSKPAAKPSLLARLAPANFAKITRIGK
ncbi:NifB/NifX family molybdenum-iron cluster-binding protein [Vibrio fluminensis]|uniref:NifB/NifX family molybdenum-iron cluster-binding protein n=1 Tax=Vibrio fluminensis TaxID=2783614 RepID=UPI0018887380|nr:NifB/NifX family molybdenum-iron cluster-binding protein [Vibrio fluminensis]